MLVIGFGFIRVLHFCGQVRLLYVVIVGFVAGHRFDSRAWWNSKKAEQLTHKQPTHKQLTLHTYIHAYIHTYLHTYIHTLLSFHTPSCFVTHPLSHSTLSHTTVLTSRSFTTSFVFPSFPVPATTFEAHYWKKLTCGVIRSFNFADIWDHPPKMAGPPELFWKFCFPFRDCFGVCSFSLQCAAFWSWKLPFQRYCNILEFEPLIFHGLCSTLVLKLLMLDDILRLGAI